MTFRIWNKKDVNADEAKKWYEEIENLFIGYTAMTTSYGLKSLKISKNDRHGYNYDDYTKIVRAIFMFEDSDTGNYFARFFNNCLDDAFLEICFE